MSTATITETKLDSVLRQEILDALEWDPSVDATHIGISVRNGVVTLSGHVPSLAEKLLAEKAVKRVPGVRGVANEIEVKLPYSSKRSDEDIAAGAVRALKWNIFVPSGQIRVTVSDGWVTLEGEVKWQFQKKAAERAVRNLTGVKGVFNLITVQPRVRPQDLQARIEDAFRRSAEVDARSIIVEVDGSKVILRGIVSSWDQKKEAEREAWAAPGVEEVENLITVES